MSIWLSQVDQLKGEKEAMSADITRVKNRIGEMSRSIAALNELKTTVKCEWNPVDVIVQITYYPVL